MWMIIQRRVFELRARRSLEYPSLWRSTLLRNNLQNQDLNPRVFHSNVRIDAGAMKAWEEKILLPNIPSTGERQAKNERWRVGLKKHREIWSLIRGRNPSKSHNCPCRLWKTELNWLSTIFKNEFNQLTLSRISLWYHVALTSCLQKGKWKVKSCFSGWDYVYALRHTAMAHLVRAA